MSDVLSVNLFDMPLGVVSKERAHSEGILHRAFSVFIHDGSNSMLIQRRALDKYHSGGLWTNACCSHPLEGSPIAEQARERMLFELGVLCEVREVFTYTYYKRFSDSLVEYEYDHVFIGTADKASLRPEPHPGEVMEWKWTDIDELAADVAADPDSYSVWFIGTLGRVIEEIRRDG